MRWTAPLQRHRNMPITDKEGPAASAILAFAEWQLLAISCISCFLVQRANGIGPPAIRDHERLRGIDLPLLGGGRDFLLQLFDSFRSVSCQNRHSIPIPVDCGN